MVTKNKIKNSIKKIMFFSAINFFNYLLINISIHLAFVRNKNSPYTFIVVSTGNYMFYDFFYLIKCKVNENAPF